MLASSLETKASRHVTSPRGGKFMKRRDFIKATGVGVAGVAIAAPAIAQSTPEIKWRMSCSCPKSLDTLSGGPELMAKPVPEATANKFHTQGVPAGEIL